MWTVLAPDSPSAQYGKRAQLHEHVFPYNCQCCHLCELTNQLYVIVVSSYSVAVDYATVISMDSVALFLKCSGIVSH